MTQADYDLGSTLAAYGAFIESQAQTQLRPSPSAVELIDDTISPVESEVVQHTNRLGHERLLATAAVLLVALAGVFTFQNVIRSDDSTVATTDAPVSGPLFILPQSAAGSTVSNGQYGENEPTVGPGPFVGGLIGRPADDSYIDLVRINILPLSAPSLDMDRFEQIGDTAMHRSEGAIGEQVMELRGDVAVLLSTPRDSIRDPESILDQIAVESDQTFEFGNGTDFVLLDRWDLDGLTIDRWWTSFDVTADGQSFIVETADMPATVVLDIGDRVREISAGDQTIWLTEIDEATYGVAWQATPTQSVFVSRSDNSPLTDDELLDVAESFEFVNRTDWFAAFPTLDDPAN